MKPKKWTPPSVIQLCEAAEKAFNTAEKEDRVWIAKLRGMTDAEWWNSDLSKATQFRAMRRTKALARTVDRLKDIELKNEFFEKLTSDSQSKDVWVHIDRMSATTIAKINAQWCSLDEVEEEDKAGTYTCLVCHEYVKAMTAPQYTADETKEHLDSLIKSVRDLRRGISTSKVISEPLIDALIFGAYAFGSTKGVDQDIADNLTVDNVLGALEWYFSDLRTKKQLVKKVNTKNFNRNFFVRSLHAKHMHYFKTPKWELLTLLTHILFASNDGKPIAMDSLRKLIS